jgi:hypothetical protein
MKKIIRWLLRHVPRPVLHRLAVPAGKLLALILKGNKYTDPIDGRTYRRLLPYGRLKSRSNALAPASLSLERHRLLWLYLKRETDLFSRPQKLLHIAPEWCFLKPLRGLRQLDYVTADLESPWADIHMDIHHMPFEDNSFDAVLCNHVLEHVTDDLQALREILRVLRPGGWAILQSPVDQNRPETKEDPSITDPREREKAFGQDDHVRLYGRDYPRRLESIGFLVEEIDYTAQLPPHEVAQYALPPGEIIYKVIKPLS